MFHPIPTLTGRFQFLGLGIVGPRLKRVVLTAAIGFSFGLASLHAADTWIQAVTASAPKYWYRFEETDPADPAKNEITATGFNGAYGPEITAADNLSKPSVLPALGTAFELTGPPAGGGTGKYVDLAVNAAAP